MHTASHKAVDPRPHRDAVLRQAHQEAFHKMSSAQATADTREVVAQAVEELIDACQAYVESR